MWVARTTLNTLHYSLVSTKQSRLRPFTCKTTFCAIDIVNYLYHEASKWVATLTIMRKNKNRWCKQLRVALCVLCLIMLALSDIATGHRQNTHILYIFSRWILNNILPVPAWSAFNRDFGKGHVITHHAPNKPNRCISFTSLKYLAGFGFELAMSQEIHWSYSVVYIMISNVLEFSCDS